jgi:hypothetical protein
MIRPSAILMNKIFAITMRMQLRFPAQYDVLDETPLHITGNEKEINTIDFEQYLETIQNQLLAFEKASRNRSIF